MVISNSPLLVEAITVSGKNDGRGRCGNKPKAAELNVRSPIIQVEGVEVFDKDGTELTVVNEADRPVVKVDL